MCRGSAQASYDAVDFDMAEFKDSVGCPGRLMHDSKASLLQHRWRYPTLSLHGIEGAFAGPGQKTVLPGACVRACGPCACVCDAMRALCIAAPFLPGHGTLTPLCGHSAAKVIGKFSLRLVPDMTPARVEELVKAYVESVFASLGSPNKLNVYMAHGAKAWVSVRAAAALALVSFVPCVAAPCCLGVSDVPLFIVFIPCCWTGLQPPELCGWPPRCEASVWCGARSDARRRFCARHPQV